MGNSKPTRTITEKTTMKTNIRYLLGAVLLALSLPALALDDPTTGFGVGTTNAGTTLSWAIVSARSANNGTPAVTFLNMGSGTAAATTTFWKCTSQTTARYATNSTVTLSVTQTNGFASGDNIIIRHMTDDSYEKRTLTTMTTATNLVTTVAPLTAVVPGDLIYKVVSAGTIIGGAAATNSTTGTPIWVGQKGKPLMVDINAGGNTACMNAVGGTYLP